MSWSSCCGTKGFAAFPQLQDTGSILGPTQCVKGFLQTQQRVQLRLGSDPWPGNSTCHRAAKKKKKKAYESKMISKKLRNYFELNETPFQKHICGLQLIQDSEEHLHGNIFIIKEEKSPINDLSVYIKKLAKG